MKLLVINAVGLRPCDLSLAPNLSRLAEDGFSAPLRTVFPAVTSTVQASFLTGTLPREHGIVANGWYFRDLAQVWLWRQSNHLIAGDKVYEEARRRGNSCAKMFWWFNMYADVDWSITPRPEYHADGLKKPGLYSHPPELAAEAQRDLGDFPLFNFWGPAADLRSTSWIVDSCLWLMKRDPDLMFAYLPHLDYDHQRFGPDHERSRAAVGDLDREAGRLADGARERGAQVMVLSEYGIEAVQTPVFINRVLHEAGYLEVQETSHGQLLDGGASRAFAVADHQVAHVYVNSESDIAEVRRLLESTAGIAEVRDRQGQHGWGIDHSRSGELVCVSEPGAWFAYHYWLDESKRPDFATSVDIHRKPGYDPTELFLDPKLAAPKLRILRRLIQKKLGFRMLMDVIGTDPSIVRGSHGRIFDDPGKGPLFIASSSEHARDVVSATEIKDRILDSL